MDKLNFYDFVTEIVTDERISEPSETEELEKYCPEELFNYIYSFTIMLDIVQPVGIVVSDIFAFQQKCFVTIQPPSK